MIKKVLVIFVLIIFLPYVTVQGSAVYQYKLNEGECIITDYLGEESFIVIPEIIDGFKVTEIGNYAFHNKGLVGVIIPDTVVKIGEFAFSDNSLDVVVLPNGITEISDGCFEWNHIETITLPEKVKTIGNAAFNQNYLAEVDIPYNVEHIGDWAFAYNLLKEIKIPNSVTYIGEYAFISDGYSEIILSEKTTYIGEHAFNNSFILPGTNLKWADESGNVYFSGDKIEDTGVSYSLMSEEVKTKNPNNEFKSDKKIFETGMNILILSILIGFVIISLIFVLFKFWISKK